MVRDGTPAETGRLYPHAGPLLSARRNEDLAAGCRGDLLRMAGSLKYGQATASLIVGKRSASSRQNTLAAALKEWGTLRRTIHAARYLSDPAYRRKIARQLNKGESLHAPRRDLHYAQQGTIGKPLLAEDLRRIPRAVPGADARFGVHAYVHDVLLGFRDYQVTGSS
jgi:TnpA family transposase